MSANTYRPHVLLLPEDDANNQILNGFLLEPSLNIRAIEPLPVAGGWPKVRERFAQDEVKAMYRFPLRIMILLVDFDEREDRMGAMKRDVPAELADRVFVLGVKTEPEDLKKTRMGSFETIGKKLAKDCVDGTEAEWSHALLRDNAAELQRMRDRVRPILFQDN